MRDPLHNTRAQAAKPFGWGPLPWPAFSRISLVAISTSWWLSGCAPPPSEEAPEIGAVVVTQWNEVTELFLEYPHLVAGEATGNWAIHLSSMETFQPVRSGRLEVRFFSGTSPAETFTIEGVARDGIFLLDPVVSAPGRYRVDLVLESPQARSTHVLPEVEVFATEADAPRAEEEDEGAGEIVFLKEQQWPISWAIAAATPATVVPSTVASGVLVAPDDAVVRIVAPVSGIALEELNRMAPGEGQVVRGGQLLAVLAPTPQEDGFARLIANVQRLEREVERAERLFAVGAIPARRLEEARHDLEVARSEAGAMGTSSIGDPSRLDIVSPLAGVIAERNFVPGGRIEAGTPLFTILRPERVWLRVAVPASLASSVSREIPATFRLEGSSVVEETTGLVSLGLTVDPATRTVPMVFDLPRGTERFVFGQLAEVRIPSGPEETGVVIPNSAIVDDNGTAVAYVQTGGESFERRVLALGATDGLRTVVRAGISPEEMVVIRGAYQVRLASMSGGEFAGGHSH